MQVLLTNPEIDELTYYLHAWTKRLLKLNKNQNNRIYHLERFKVTRRRFEGLLKKKEIDLLLLCGHGEEDKIEGEEEIILDKENVYLLEGKTVHALSCQSAKKLGPLAKANGAKAFIGYKEDFIVFMDNRNRTSKPFDDEIAALFLDSAFTALELLLKQEEPEEVFAKTKEAYDKNIQKALNSDIQPDADQFIGWLYWDRDNLELC